MANGKFGSWGAGTGATSTGGKAALPTKARTDRGTGIQNGPVTSVRTAGGVQPGGSVAKVAGEDRWSGMRGSSGVTKVAGENRWKGRV